MLWLNFSIGTNLLFSFILVFEKVKGGTPETLPPPLLWLKKEEMTEGS